MKQKKLIFVVAISLILVLCGMYTIMKDRKLEYGYGKSNDGQWEAYVLPDEANFAIGVLLYNGNEEQNAGDIYVQMVIDGRKDKTIITPQNHVFEIVNYMESLVIGDSSKKYYDFLEFSDELQPDVKLKVKWIEDGERKESKLKIKYRKDWKFLHRKKNGSGGQTGNR